MDLGDIKCENLKWFRIGSIRFCGDRYGSSNTGNLLLSKNSDIFKKVVGLKVKK
jgi:hypothetical protein